MKTKKIPLRMCLGCNEMKPKKEMIRVVKSPEGEISLDTCSISRKNPERNPEGVHISAAAAIALKRQERQDGLKKVCHVKSKKAFMRR